MFYSEERHEAAASFAIKTNPGRKLLEFPKRINGRTMELRLRLSGNNQATIVSAYVATTTSSGEAKDMF